MATQLLTLVLISLPTVISALPTTATRLGAGSCSAYPGTFIPGDNFIFHPFTPTNSTLNNLPTVISSNGSLIVLPDNTSSGTLFCCDAAKGALIEDRFGVQSLMLSSDGTGELRYFGLEDSGPGLGNVPETYAVESQGVKLDGVFLGQANVTSWGFRWVGGEGYYGIRLLGAGDGLQDGEVEGFLKIVLPS